MSFLLNHVNMIVGNLGIALMHRELVDERQWLAEEDRRLGRA